MKRYKNSGALSVLFLVLFVATGIIIAGCGSNGSTSNVSWEGADLAVDDSNSGKPRVTSCKNSEGSTSLSAGEECIIDGAGFGESREGNSADGSYSLVRFVNTSGERGYKDATAYSSWSDSQIKCTVPQVSSGGTYEVYVLVAEGVRMFTPSSAADSSANRVNINSAPGSVYALFIGINEYVNITPLRYCVNDANGMKDSLLSCALWENATVISLTDSEATKEGIESTLTGLTASIGQDDLFFMFYAGHGTNDGQKSYICPVNCTNDTSTMISDQELHTLLGDISAQAKKCIIFDSCNSGGFINKNRGFTSRFWEMERSHRVFYGDSFTKQLEQLSNIVVLTACRGNQTSIEDSELQHGVFTYYIIEGLGSGATLGPADSDSGSFITAAETYDYAAPKASSYAGSGHEPQIQNNYQGDLIIKE